MKVLVTIYVVLLLGLSNIYAAPVYTDSVQQHQLSINNDSLKALNYTKIAAGYLQYDTISSPGKKLLYQDEAIDNTLSALRYYSRYNDTAGLRTSFNILAKVYHAQKKYSQAKWFILQSNTLSRDQNDIPDIISSLIELAAIKIDIKDYDLARDDLNEALKLAKDNHYAQTESTIEQSFALLYTHLKNYSKATVALKRHNFIDDSIHQHEEALLLAKINAANLAQARKKELFEQQQKSLSERLFERNSIIIILIIVIILITIAVLFTYRRKRRSK